MADDGINSRESAERAGWNDAGELRPRGTAKGSWETLLLERRELKWGSFSWLTVRALFESVNDFFAKFRPELIDERRARWLAEQQGRRPRGIEDLVVSRVADGDRALFLVGDTGEQDASQYAVAPLLYNGAVRGPAGAGGAAVEPEFMVIVSDVIYPAGNVNEYVNGFYIPYQAFEKTIYALPGNHDWYDGLDGFMYHFCGADPLPPETFRATEVRPATRLAQLLWRGAELPKRQLLSRWRKSRHWRRDLTGAVQPAPYFAIDLGDLLLVCIDTGVTGSIDEEQALWLIDISGREQQKILLTGKPIYVDNAYHPGEIAWNHDRDEEPHDLRCFETVDDIVRKPGHRYVAAIGGDVHNYQRYPIRFRDESGQPKRTIHYLVSGGGGAYLSPTHRIPPLSEEPQSKHPWPRDELSMPKDEDLFDPMPNRGTVAGDPTAFRCYPRRGDSLAYTARSAGPRIFEAVQLAGIAFVLAASTLLYELPLHRTGALGLAVVYGPLVLAAAAYLGATEARDWWRRKHPRRSREKSKPGVAPGVDKDGRREKEGGGIPGGPVTIGLGAATALGLVAWAVDALSGGAPLLSNPRFWGIVGIALIVPFLVLGAIVWAHDLRGSIPSSLPELALAGAIAAAIAIQWPCGPVGDAPAWFVTAVALLAFTGLGTAALSGGRRHRPDWKRGAGYRVLDALVVVTAPAVLAASLAHNTDSDRAWLVGVAIAVAGAYPFLVARRPSAAGTDATSSRAERIGPRFEAAMDFFGVAGWIAVAALLLHMIGNGWIAVAAIGAVAALVVIAVAGLLAFLSLGTGKLKGRVAVCLLMAVLLVAARFVCWPLYLLVSTPLLGAALWSVWQLRSGTLNADAAQTKIRARLRDGGPAREGAWPRSLAMPSGQETLFDLLYPYKWKRDGNRDLNQGAGRTGTLSQLLAKLIAELGDSDEPPFFKHLLRVDVRRRDPKPDEPEDRELTIRCFGVTGYETEETDPPLEDEISIPFHSKESLEAETAT